jgi:hypothetical protein
VCSMTWPGCMASDWPVIIMLVVAARHIHVSGKSYGDPVESFFTHRSLVRNPLTIRSLVSHISASTARLFGKPYACAFVYAPGMNLIT